MIIPERKRLIVVNSFPVIWYGKASDGTYAKCRFVNMDCLTYGLLILFWSEGETGVGFKEISPLTYNKALFKAKSRTEYELRHIDTNELIGDFTELIL
jgi:hypothetical protein